MSSFEPALNHVIEKDEGRLLELVKGDSGGQTYCGIARNPNPGWEGWSLIDAHLAQGHGIKELNEDAQLQGMVKAFYLRGYWLACRCDLMPDQMALAVFSAAVNSGAGSAIQWLQRSLNQNENAGLKDDGGLGPATTAALQKMEPNRVFRGFMAHWGRHYLEIVEKKPDQLKFIHDWLSRWASYFAAPAA